MGRRRWTEEEATPVLGDTCGIGLFGAFSSWRNRLFQWILDLVPLIKALQMALWLLFWYSCVHLHTCSLWILFQTASFVTVTTSCTSTLPLGRDAQLRASDASSCRGDNPGVASSRPLRLFFDKTTGGTSSPLWSGYALRSG